MDEVTFWETGKYLPNYFSILDNNGCGRRGFQGNRPWNGELHTEALFLGNNAD